MPAGRNDAATSARTGFPWNESREITRGPMRVVGTRTKVLLCGDQTLYRAALRILVETREDFRIVAETTCERSRLEEALRSEIDLVLMDHDLTAATTAQLTSLATLLDRLAPRPVVIATAELDPRSSLTALRHGASALVLKTRGEESLLEAMESARRGLVWIEQRLLTQILSESPRVVAVPGDEQLKIDQLTQREREIAEVACTGLTNKQIAEKLSISEATVRHHLGSVFAKLGVATRSELAAYGYRHHLVDSRRDHASS
jgi:DNA-binding NarL/FixJ family response regulator